MDLKEIDINTVNWVDSTQDINYWRAFLNAALNLRFPQAMKLVSNYREVRYETEFSKYIVGNASVHHIILFRKRRQ